MRRIYPLLLGVGLTAGPALAQQPAAPAVPEAASPIPPALDDPTLPLTVEPAPAQRQLYARQRVRSVLKVRLDAEGNPRDTVEYQEIDAQGRRTLLRRYGPRWQERREWSYDAAGHCTAMVIHAVPGRSFTTIYAYNPALGRSRCEVLRPDGSRATVCELQRQPVGDTIVTEARFTGLAIDRYRFPDAGLHRSWRFALSPDTVLTLLKTYSLKGKPQASRLQYELRQQGQIIEQGLIDVHQAWQPARRAAEHVALLELVAALRRQPASFRAAVHFRYDARQRLIEEQKLHSVTETRAPALAASNTSVPDPRNPVGPVSGRGSTVPPPIRPAPPAYQPVQVQVPVRITFTNTYNHLDQLIGQQRRQVQPNAPDRIAYTVLSYSPEGLSTGETNRTDGPAVFYRYSYQYHP